MCLLQDASRHEHNELGRRDGGIFANSSSVLSMNSEEIYLDDHTEKELASEVELWRMETVNPVANPSTTEYSMLHAQLLGSLQGMDEFEQLKRNQPYGRVEPPSLLGLSGVLPQGAVPNASSGATGTAAGTAAAALAAAAAAEAASLAATVAATREGTASTSVPSGESGRSRQSAEDGLPPHTSDLATSVQAENLQQSSRGAAFQSNETDGMLTMEDATAVEVDAEEAVVLNSAVHTKVAYKGLYEDAAASPKSHSSSGASTFAGFIEAGGRDEHDEVSRGSRRAGALMPKEDNVRPDRPDMLY